MTYIPRTTKRWLGVLCVVMVVLTVHAQPKIIIKLDDLDASSSFNVMVPTFDYLAITGIKAGFGAKAIGKISDTQIAAIKNYMGKVNSKGEALFEIWHHGLDHTKDIPPGTWEFSGTTYAYQKAHFDSGSGLLKSKLGVTARTFGAPYNQTDATLLQVMSEDPNMKVILLAQQTPSASSGIMNLKNRVNMESATGVVDYAYFVANYTAQKSVYKDYMVLQGHPGQWTTDALKGEFKKIVAFLIAEGCEFVTPYGYYEYVNKSTFPVPVHAPPGEAPKSYNLLQVYPNPFNPSTNIQFTVPTTGHASLKIVNALGEDTATLYDQVAESGRVHRVRFDASGLASGNYFSCLEHNGTMHVHKLVLLK